MRCRLLKASARIVLANVPRQVFSANAAQAIGAAAQIEAGTIELTVRDLGSVDVGVVQYARAQNVSRDAARKAIVESIRAGSQDTAAANPDAKLIPVVDSVTSEIEAMAGAAESELSRGGMTTKIEAAKIATIAGTHMLIASGKIEHPLQAIADGGRCTWFLTPANPVTARKRWIAGSLEPKGTLTIDAGAVSALRAGKSLLPAGVIRVDGQFARGDAVVVRGPDTHEIGRGLVAYDADDAEKIKGRSSSDAAMILGVSGRAEMIHRDDLVMGPGGSFLPN